MNKGKNILDTIRSKQPNYPDTEYFEQMARNVIAEHSSPFIKIPFYKKSVVKWIAAAAVIVPFVFFFSINPKSNSHNSLTTLDHLPQESILHYIAEQKETEALLVVESNSSAKKAVYQLSAKVEKDDIINYLSEEYGDWEDSKEEYLFY
jgi:hypothetical protein